MIGDDGLPRLSSIRSRLVALDRSRPPEVAMSIVPALPLLDLSTRPSARMRTFHPGSSVWLREDVRLADGASKIVAAVFGRYDRRQTRCMVIRGPAVDNIHSRPEWVSIDDVFARHWADTDPGTTLDDRPRLAWLPRTEVPLDAGPTSFLLVWISILVVVGFFAVAMWGLVP